MIILGLLLAAVGAVFGLDLLWKNKFRVPEPVVFGQSLGISSGRWLFILGVIVGAAITLGVAMLLGGLGRKRAKAVAAHQNTKDRQVAETERDTLQVDNDRLRRQLDEQIAREPHPTAGSRDRAGATRADSGVDDPDIGRPNL
jgi:hypothetical protein